MSTTDQQDSTCGPIEWPAGIQLTNVKVSPLGFQMKFPNPRHDKPLPPVVEATINDRKELEISIVVFISENARISPDELCVIQDFSYTNDRVPYSNFYVCYNVVPEPSSTFNIFQLDFVANPEGYTPNNTLPPMRMPNILDLKEIVSFLLDQDPKLSRGTVTTVQSGV